MTDRINVSFTVNDAYAKYLATAITSILENAHEDDDLYFYIITSDLSLESKRKIETLKTIKNFSIEYITLSSDDIPAIPENNNAHVTQETNFRLRIASLKPDLDKILCLDCDLVVVSSLSKLYNIELNDYWAACAIDAPNYGGCNNEFILKADLKQYFNTGVCLINLKAWRKNKVEERIFDCLHKYSSILRYPDQDLLNLALNEHVLELNHQWNVFVGCLDLFYPLDIQKFILQNPRIIHWAGREKPWKYPTVALSDYFWKYARQTPFYEEILFNNLTQKILPQSIVQEKISYTDDYLLTKLKYAKCKLLSKFTFGTKRSLYRQRKKELKKQLKLIKHKYKEQEKQKES